MASIAFTTAWSGDFVHGGEAFWSGRPARLPRSDDMPAAFDQADAQSLYEQMRPDQRTTIALEFVRCLQLEGEAAAEQFMAQAEQVGAADEKVEVIGGALVTPRLLSAQQAAAIHRYTFDYRPD
jgi:hypothetical protein